MKRRVLVVFSIIVLIPSICIAHSGRTDSNGGHWDYSTGGYHYHHGYSAHKHINGLCPYETDLKDLLPDKCSNCNGIVNVENGYYCFECGYDLASLSGIRISLVDGKPDKTRSEYYKETEELKNKVEDLQTELNNKKKTINKLNNEISQKNKELNNLKDNIGLGIIFSIIIMVIMVLWIKNPFKNK